MSDAVTITGIAAGGDGVGRLADGRAVFVPRAAPGERVRLRAGGLKLHKHFARGEIGEIVEVGATRVTPPCQHYGQDRCGGCQLQHLSYDAQLAAKRAIVGDALRRIGKLEVEDPEIVEAVEEWRYQAKLTLVVRRSGARNGGGAIASLGLHPYDRPGHVFALTDCHVADFRLMALWRDVRAHLDLLPPGLSRLTLRLDREGRRHVVAESQSAWDTAEALRAALPDGPQVTCWVQAPEQPPRLVAGSPCAFAAANPEMALLARRWAVQQVGEVRDQVAWDLYGGSGDTAALLAELGAEVVSVDADEQAIAWAGQRGFPGSVRCIAGRVEDVVSSLPLPRAAVVNPPPGGLHWDVTLRLAGEPVPRLVYVSCDPATLARDLHRLSVNYKVTALRAFDLFPQTARVETVVALEAV